MADAILLLPAPEESFSPQRVERLALQSKRQSFVACQLTRRDCLQALPRFLGAPFVLRRPSTRISLYTSQEKLAQLEERFLGAHNRGMALALKRDARALQRELRPYCLRHADARRLWIHCAELIRDVLPQPDFPLAWRVVQHWRLDGDPLQLSKALLQYANFLQVRLPQPVKRGDRHWRQAMHLLQLGYHVLSGPCPGHDRAVVELFRHQMVLFRIRFIALWGGEPQQASRERERLRAIANAFPFTLIRRETAREEAHVLVLLAQRHGKKARTRLLNEAEKQLDEARDLTVQLDMPSAAQGNPHHDLSLLIPEIDLLLAAEERKKKQRAVERMEQYLQLSSRYPSAVSIRRLERWVAANELSGKFPDLPRPVCEVPISIAEHYDTKMWEKVLAEPEQNGH